MVKNSNNTLLNSKVTYNRNVGNHSSYNETVVIYDINTCPHRTVLES